MVIVRWLVGLLLLLVFSLFAFVVWLAVNEDVVSEDGEPPLIKAEGLPFKVEPEERGGIAIMNENSSLVQALDRGIDEPVVEQILPPPEPPPRSAAEVLPEGPATAAADASELPASPGIQTETVQPSAPEPIAPADLEVLESAEPPSEVTAINPILAEIAEPEPIAPQPPNPEPEPTAGVPIDIPIPNATAPSQQLPVVFAGPASNDNESAQSVEPNTAREATPAPPPEPGVAEQASASGSTDVEDRFRIQLSALRQPDQAEQAWVELREQFASVLGDAQLFVQRSETDRGIFYRVQAGRFQTRELADAGCNAIKAQGGDCFVVRGAN